MASNKYPQFILFGDSITQYTSFLRDGFSFGAALEEHCQRRLDIINRGLSGYNTSQGLHIIDDIIPSTDVATVDYLLVAFGANDAVLPGFTQHVPLEKYQQNLQTIINHPRVKAHDPMILLVAPPPINVSVCDVEDKKRGYSESIRKLPVTAQYAQVTRDVAKSAQDTGRKVTLVDLWTAMSTEGEKVGLQKLLVDGLHFTGDGYKVFYDEVVKHVGQSWKEEPLDAPSWVFPHWSIAPGSVKL